MIRAVENQRILHDLVVENQNKILRMQMDEASYIRQTTRLILDVQKKLMADLSDNQQQIKHLKEKIKEQNSTTSDLQQQLSEVCNKYIDMEEEKDAVWKKCKDLLDFAQMEGYVAHPPRRVSQRSDERPSSPMRNS